MNSLTRYAHARPSTPAELRQEVEQLFSEFLPGWRTRTSEEPESSVWTPRVDVSENDDAYLINMDLPGVKKEDVNINFEDGVLTVSGERRQVQAGAGDQKLNFYRVERRYGRFHRSFSLPKLIDVDGIRATYEHGVLNLYIPKAEEVKARRIEVQ